MPTTSIPLVEAAGKRLPKGQRGGIELLLVPPVEHLGKQGEVVEVKRGYALNYLLPQGLATVATDHHKRMVEKHRAKLEEIARERLALPSIYFAHEREVVRRGDLLVPVTDITPMQPGDMSEVVSVRCSGGCRSTATILFAMSSTSQKSTFSAFCSTSLTPDCRLMRTGTLWPSASSGAMPNGSLTLGMT